MDFLNLAQDPTHYRGKTQPVAQRNRDQNFEYSDTLVRYFSWHDCIKM